MTKTKSTLVYTTGFAGVAFQVCTTDATIYIKFFIFDVV